MKIVVIMLLCAFLSNCNILASNAVDQKEQQAAIHDLLDAPKTLSIFQGIKESANKVLNKFKTFFLGKDVTPYCAAILKESPTLAAFQNNWNPKNGDVSCLGDELICIKKNEEAFATGIQCYH